MNLCLYAGPEGKEPSQEEVKAPTEPSESTTQKLPYQEAEWYQKLWEEQKEKVDTLIRKKIDVIEDFKAQMGFLWKKYTILENGIDLLAPPEDPEDIKEITNFREAIDMIQKDIALYENQVALIKLQIDLLEAPGDTEKRHELLNSVFDSLPEKSKEWLLGNSIDALTAGDIYSMKQNGVDLSTVFLVTKEGKLSNGKASMKSWDSFRVNFWASKNADAIVGAGDILPIEDVYSVKINGVEGIRRFLPRPGYYTPEGNYLAIHDGYNVQIGEKKPVTPQELQQLEAARQKRYEYIRSEDVRDIIRNLENETDTVPFTSPADLQILNDMIAQTGIEGLNYDAETKKWNIPEGMNFGDVKEVFNDYQQVKSELIKYLSENKNSITQKDGVQSIKLKSSAYSPVIIEKALQSMVGQQNAQNISFDASTKTLSVTGGLKIESIIMGGAYEYTWKRNLHLRYQEAIISAAQETGVPAGAITTLIYKENHTWNPHVKAPGSSAYGLGQMINGTWKTYGQWLDRHNPKDQLLATARYMKAIKGRKNCPWEHVLAYYNTWEGIRNVSNAKIHEYARLNPVITRRIPNGVEINKDTYFTAAVSYYNSISYQQAMSTLRVK